MNNPAWAVLWVAAWLAHLIPVAIGINVILTRHGYGDRDWRWLLGFMVLYGAYDLAGYLKRTAFKKLGGQA